MEANPAPSGQSGAPLHLGSPGQHSLLPHSSGGYDDRSWKVKAPEGQVRPGEAQDP